jgi:hypothetical protein
MQQAHANSLDELKALLAPFDGAFLFRGQVNHYAAEDGTPILNSSFARQGCVPPLMLKWSFYIRELLRRGGFDVSRGDTIDITQGLLQHYGWRSFFVDLSSSKSVAAWFACNAFESKRGFDLCENSFEEPVMLALQRARYNPVEGVGNFYVLNKERLKNSGHKVVSLVDDLESDCDTRYMVQKAWLASIFLKQTRLEPNAIAAHFTAPAAVLRELAEAEGYTTTGAIFPDSRSDAMLKQFLALPRMKLNVPDPMFPVYVRSLDIPEYQDSFVKILPQNVVLAEEFWPTEKVDLGGISMRVPEETFYGSIEVGPLPGLVPYLQANPLIQVETDRLICFPVSEGNDAHDKGMYIRRTADGLYQIGSLSAVYRSSHLVGINAAEGYFYRIENNQLIRVPTERDCPCDDPPKHAYHLRACAIIDDMIRTGSVSRQGNVITVAP